MAAQDLIRLWEQHVRGEFIDKDEDLSLATMTEDASVLHIPSQSGASERQSCAEALLPGYVHPVDSGSVAAHHHQAGSDRRYAG